MTILICTSAIGYAEPNPNPLPDSFRESEISNILKEAYTHILHDYVRVPDRVTLVSGALARMEQFAVSKGSPPFPNGLVPTSVPQTDADVFHILEAGFSYLNKLETIDRSELVYAAIQGMLNQLDEHSVLLTPKVYQAISTANSKNLAGVGIQLGMKDKHLTVLATAPGTLAQRAGILPGDHIIKLGGESAEGVPLLEANQRILGPLGTKINFTIVREGVSSPLQFQLYREMMRKENVESQLLNNSVGYVRMRHFDEGTARRLKAILSALLSQNVRGLVIDLRCNDGGSLNSAVAVAEQFLKRNRKIVLVQGRSALAVEYVSRDGSYFDKPPIILMVNAGSSAEAEVIAGALQDYGRSAIVGTPTSGRGNVQRIFLLSDGSVLKLTTARLYTPKGRSIADAGIQPDVLVVEEQHRDAPLDAASALLEEALK